MTPETDPFTLLVSMSTDPVLIAYTAKRTKNGQSSVWTRIGQAYPHDIGAGLTVVLDSIPLDGRIILLELADADDRQLIKEADMRGAQRDSGKRAPLDAPALRPRES